MTYLGNWAPLLLGAQDENGHARWEWSCAVTFVWWAGHTTQGENGLARWHGCMWWEWSYKVTFSWWRVQLDKSTQSHLAPMQNGKIVSHGCEVTLGRCYLSDVQSANDEDFQKFSLILLQSHLMWPSPPCTHVKWQICLAWMWGDFE